MKLSPAGVDLLKQHEGFFAKAYWDADGYSVGYGHHGPEVTAFTRVTWEEACCILEQDVARFEGAVNDLVTVPLAQHQFDALVAFTYNVGRQAFASSTLLKLVNAGQMEKAALQFARWNHSQGKVLAGLTKRRAAEAELFQKA
jgi:lysozyme